MIQRLEAKNRNENSWALILQVPRWLLHLRSYFHFALSSRECFKPVLSILLDPFSSPFPPRTSTSGTTVSVVPVKLPKTDRRNDPGGEQISGCELNRIQLNPNNWMGTNSEQVATNGAGNVSKCHQNSNVPWLAHQNINYSHLWSASWA